MKKQTTTPKPNKRLFRRIQKFILAEPRRLDMDSWVTHYNSGAAGPWVPPCRTTSCIAGTALLLTGTSAQAVQHLQGRTIFRRSEQLLGLPLSRWQRMNSACDFEMVDPGATVSARLFLAHNWPSPYRERFLDLQQKLGEFRTLYYGYFSRPCQPKDVGRLLTLSRRVAKLTCRRIDHFLETGK